MNKFLNEPFNGKWTKRSKLAEKLFSEYICVQHDKGQKLPSVRDVAKKYNVSCCTAANAMKLLEEKGILQQIPGKGTFLLEKKNSVKVGICYDPDIYTKKEYACCLQKTVYDYLYDHLDDELFSLVPINVYGPQEEILQGMEQCAVIIQCASSKPEEVLNNTWRDGKKNIICGNGITFTGENENFCITVSQNIIKGVYQFLSKHDLKIYEKIVFIYHYSSRGIVDMVKNIFEKQGIPEENLIDMQLPVSNFTATDVTKRYMESKKNSFRSRKVLLISMSGYFREGLFDVFTNDERPDILQFEAEHIVPKNFSIKGRGFLACLNSRYDHLGEGVLQAIKMSINGEYSCCGKLLTEMEYREFIPKK